MYVLFVGAKEKKKRGNVKRMYERICPDCGAHLDPDEKCDCQEEKESNGERILDAMAMLKFEKDGQMAIDFKEAV